MPEEGEIKRSREVGLADNKGSERLIWRVCIKCGDGKWVRLRSCPKICGKCVMKNKLKGHHPTWKGGRIGIGDGYTAVYSEETSPFHTMNNKKYILEHRLIMAKHLGRCLVDGEVVHHLNGIKGDNRLENLVLVNRNTHPHRTIAQLQAERIKELEKQLEEL